MRQDLFDKLKLIAPRLFSDLKSIECGDGWFLLLKQTSATIEHHINDVPEELQSQIKVVQIKQKFGSLRYYCDVITPFMDGVITLAERLSAYTCESCGNHGDIKIYKAYANIICDSCRVENKK